MMTQIGALPPAQDSTVRTSAVIYEAKIWRGKVQHNCKTGTLVQTTSGDILASWYGGETSEKGYTELWTARYSAGKWGEPVPTFKRDGHNLWNPVFFKTEDGSLALFCRTYKPVGEDTHSYKRDFTHHVMYSKDDGRTWQDHGTLKDISGPTKCTPLLLRDKSWLIPSSEPGDNAQHNSWLMHTKDRGKTWTKIGPILRKDGRGETTEPSLVQTSDKVVHVFLRNRQKAEEARFVLLAQFDPEQKALSIAKPTNVPNPDSGVDAVALPDGRLLMAANPCSKGKSPLSLLLSTDNGQSWKTLFNLQEGTGDFTQPALLLANDGKLHVIYSFWSKETEEKNIKHLIIDVKGI